MNQDANYVYTDLIDHRTFAETKRYRKGDNINRNYENQVLRSYDRQQEKHRHQATGFLQDEFQLREIIREEIRKYHHDTDKNTSYPMSESYASKNYEDIDDAEIITDEDMRKRRENEDINDNDHFYERREFDNDRFGKRTPGL